MYIESIQLKNYRNYESLDMKLDKGTNILYGDNAQGKTNILEAIYLGGTTKSHRGSKDREIIKFEEDESHIRMVVSKKNMKYRIDMHLKKKQGQRGGHQWAAHQKGPGIIWNCKPCVFFSGGFEYYKKWSRREKTVY